MVGVIRLFSSFTSGRALALAAVLTLVAVGLYSPVALAIVVLDGGWVAGLFGAAAGLGVWLIRPFVSKHESRDCQILLGMALGLGVLALLGLGLGVVGVMARRVWVFIICAGIGALVVRAALWITRPGDSLQDGARPNGSEENPGERRLQKGPRLRQRVERSGGRDEPRGPSIEAELSQRGSSMPAWYWLLVIPFAVIALLCACFPPGSLLRAEGNGYDVLEYHLAAPKEYYAAGRISYLPHNIYSNFPFNMEMLYLVTMNLRGGPMEALYSSQLLHVGFGVLAAGLIWVAARPMGARPAVVAAVAAATCPIVAHLGGLAYVENGLLAMTGASLACAIRVHVNREAPEGANGQRIDESSGALGWAALCGAFAGLACGFKYTAVPMVMMPMGIVCAWPRRSLGTAWWRRLAAFALTGGCLFAPWLVKNAVMTGNPVFPLARGVIRERPGLWSDMLAKRWRQGHEPAFEEQSVEGRLRALGQGVIASPEYGAMVWLLPIGLGVVMAARALRARHRNDAMVADATLRRVGTIGAFATLAMLSVWLTATHLVSRFAIPVVASQAVLAGGFARASGAWGRRWLPLVMVVCVVANLGLLVRLRWNSALFEFPREWVGQTAVMTETEPIHTLNEILSAGKRILLVAEARTLYLTGAPPRYEYSVVFNPCPFADVTGQYSAEQSVDWLCNERFDYVYVDWAEMHRLRRTRYGFWPSLDENVFARLVEAGLVVKEEFRIGPDSKVFATLFAVPKRCQATEK